MPRPDLQQPESAVTPQTWESSPWNAEDRVVEEPMRLGAREQPLRLDEDHVIDAPLESESIRRVTH